MAPGLARHATDWAVVARFAERLRDGRAAGDPAQVAAGRLTPAQAADRLRLSAGLATLWRAAADRAPLDTRDPERALSATWRELADEARRVADALARDPARPVAAGIADSMADALQPFSDGLPRPHVVVLHETELAWQAGQNRKAAA